MIYVYCVTDERPDFRLRFGKGDGDLHVIGRRSLFAVVKTVADEEFGQASIDERLRDGNWLKSKVLEHEETVERIMADYSLLPCKFATVFESQENVEKMLDENQDAFTAIIGALRGNEEWSVRVYVDGEQLRASLKDNDEIARMDEEIERASPGKAYILKKKRELLADAVAELVVNRYGALCVEALEEQSVLAKISELPLRSTTERMEEMILNSVFLVERKKATAFVKTVEDLQETYSAVGLSFDWTGPWPPYNFCTTAAESRL